MKQAVVIIHGMGEPIPMEMLTSFVDSVWTDDESLVDRSKPDPNTGGTRQRNASWSKPDRRNRSYELRVITTETGRNEKRTDFFEYYWAHLIVDTTWAQVRRWIFELMLRNPKRDVPRNVLPVWIILWLIAVLALVVGFLTLDPSREETWLGAVVATAVTAGIGWFLSGFMVRYFGDVARYVKAKPPNVARRQEIRENGVQLLETLMGIQADGSVAEKRPYDRIVVVAHSLGTIVAYDILTHAFARINSTYKTPLPATMPQPQRIAMEDMIRRAAGFGAATAAAVPPPAVGEAGVPASAPAAATPDAQPLPWSVDGFQQLQVLARKELNASGNPWIVSDFVTLGSPLTHAEFLMVRDRKALGEAKMQRIFPTCPPALEYDGSTKLHHFTYRGGFAKIGDKKDPTAPRMPHHAALFAYTRWSNIYSQSRWILLGDLISGRLAEAFGFEANGKTVCGIRDVAVMPRLTGAGKPVAGDRRRFFTHTKYWRPGAAPAGSAPGAPAAHIQALRDVLRLGED